MSFQQSKVNIPNLDQVKDNNREVVTLFRITSSSITNIAFNSRNNLYK